MAEVNLSNALDKIRSEKVIDRKDGLADLRHILTQNKRTSKLEVLPDKAHHKIFEALFRIAKVESSTYARSSSRAPAKAQAASRLSTCAGVLRLAVELGVQKLRYKTVKALVDHIVQTLPNADEGYCAPLVLDYFKTLRTILDYQPHAEHLPKDDWHELTDFCIESVVSLNSSPDDGDSSLSHRVRASDSFSDARSRSVTPHVRDSARRSTQRASQRSVNSTLKASTEDIVLCLRNLHSVSNAPIIEKSEVVLQTMLELLDKSSNASHVQQAAFDCINAIIARIVTEDSSLASQTLKSLVPLVCRFWQGKSPTLRDSMLVSLILGESYFLHLLQSNASGDFKADLRILLEAFKDDYCKRNDRDKLQVEDLDLSQVLTYNQRQAPLGLTAFRPRLGLHKAEQPWALLQVGTAIMASLDSHILMPSAQAEIDDAQHSSKRRKLQSAIGEVIQSLKAPQTSGRLYALQILSFLIAAPAADKRLLQQSQEDILSCLSDTNDSVVSWAMLAMSCGARQDFAQHADFEILWLQIWRICVRHTTASVTCRPACHLMASLLKNGLLKYPQVKDQAEGILSSVDSNGLVEAVDATLDFWATAATLRAADNLGSAQDTVERVLRWLFVRWSPKTLFDRQHTAQSAQFCPTSSILNLLLICLGRPVRVGESCQTPNLGRIGQASLKSLEARALIRYILLQGGNFMSEGVDGAVKDSQTFQIPLSSAQSKRSYDMIIDHLLTEISMTKRELSSANPPGTQSITTDMIQVIVSLAAVGYAMLAYTNAAGSYKAKDVRTAVDDLMGIVVQRVLLHGSRGDLLNAIYEPLAAFPLRPARPQQSQVLLQASLIAIAKHLFPVLQQSPESHATPNGTSAPDADDFEEDFESQASHSKRVDEDVIMDGFNDEIAAATNQKAFLASQAAKGGCASQFSFPDCMENAGAFVDYLMSMQPRDFLSCRHLINEALNSDLQLNEKDVCKLLEYLAQEILPVYEFERSGSSLGVCLDIMTVFADVWTCSEATETGHVGASLYEWFIKVALGKRISSPHVYISISSMLRRVITIRPEYARSLSLVSARTSLFQVLNEGNLLVKYVVGTDLSEIFGLFVLKEHDNILADIIDNLPNAADWLEGLAVRLYVLARLGAAWSTLLRQCIFRLFETSGHIPISIGHAKLCVGFISRALSLNSTQELFKLFVPQIMYTWLETQTLETIPYSIFAYASIAELLYDIQDEVVGQVVMRGNEDVAVELTQKTGRSYRELIETSFSKVSAYCMARDIAVPPTQATQAAGAETRLRKMLGKDQYATLIATHFPTILVTFYQTVDQEGQIIKGFQKHPAMKESLIAYEAMTAISASDKPVPPNQQPSFKGSFLVDEIDHLCNRTSYEIDSMWSPALFVKVFRDLMNTIHPALGSLHACSVLRRIRILVCMAGSTALALYPLEMMLHSFRPFLTDPQCSDDTIGIVQYLLDQGTPYIREIPRFLAGMAVSTLISMKSFLGSKQESTTQESQHQATITKAQQFHSWFAQYLSRYDSPQVSGQTLESFRTIVKVSRNVQAKGNARRGTYESDLMMELFDDEVGRNLFNQPSRDLVLGLLCSSFEAPPSFREDVAGNDQKAAIIAKAVWHTCRRVKCGDNFLLWAARVLGRAFATSGSVNFTVLPEEYSDEDHNKATALTDSPTSQSKLGILKCLGDLVLVEDREEVGMAETTLRAIVNGAKGTDDFSECEQLLPPSLMESMVWTHYGLPVEKHRSSPKVLLAESAAFDETKPSTRWVQQLCVALALSTGPDSMLSQLPPILETVKPLPKQIFPYILHLALSHEAGGNEVTKPTISKAFREWFSKCSAGTTSQIRILVEAVLYLGKQPLLNESAISDRSRWLDLDYKDAARAAAECSMFTTALMFLEIDLSEATKASRRSSVIKRAASPELLLNIYEHIDEQDSIYGVQQPSSLATLMERLEYERAGFKSLSFRGAHYDSQLRGFKEPQREDEEGVVRILNTLNLQGLSQSILSKLTDPGPSSVDSTLSTARKLEQWDISVPISHKSDVSTVFKALQGIVNALDKRSVASALEIGLSQTMELLIATSDAAFLKPKVLNALAILTEADETFSSASNEQLHEVHARFQSRTDWMDNDSFQRIDDILSCRETLLSSLSKSNKLQQLLRVTHHEARVVESSNLLANSRISRNHGALQHALTKVTYLTGLVAPCENAGVTISAAAQFESARVLWDQGEMSTSIKMLEDLLADPQLESQSLKVGRPELLARMGHQIAEARLEKPDEIIRRYLTPAIEELSGVTEGSEAGQVYHEFASFCDQQLQNADGLEDFQRIQRLRERKEAEVQDLERMIRAGPSQGKERDNLKSYRSKAKLWYDIDDREYQRLRDNREAFLRQSLENYLLCLQACDRYDNDALRFAALWLENWSSAIANSAVSKYMSNVPSGKFASLMNQWTSRLLENTNDFQKQLSALVTRISVEHPYHGIYQLFAGSKTRSGKDDAAISRHNAASAIVNIVKHHKTTGPIWIILHNTSISFVKFAQERLDESKAKPNTKMALRKTNYGAKMENDIKTMHIPPPTMNIPLRPNRNYSDVPTITRWLPEFSIASGISMPKVATAITTDGKHYKQLFKSGNDDLRQDVIMEQVFAQVSALLRAQRSTRQRNLGIRTYKVIPLTATSGIIEFVPNTIPLHEYLIPAHTRHYPKDLKPNTCRKYIADAQSKSAEKRIDVYRKVTRDFRPVLRYFFLERFQEPDEWFERRLAYTRSTAAISILGHALGLGDRHGHNILLDEKSGEVVHIDLGIAFEQGRVLPVPEVVPFRLTRDVVDGFGITKTEGVFRRCCEFTLEALRNESYSIMTILDVLRYDPLYSWSLSPLRLAKMQEAQTEGPNIKDEDGEAAPGRKGGESEPGEADRALTVVSKKLSKSLSVVATVNELIQQATDERNLALLFCGWAAYA